MGDSRTARLDFNLNGGPLLVSSPSEKRTKPLVCGSTDGFDSLWRLNIAAAVLHAILAIMILGVGLGGNSPFTLVVTRSLPKVPTPIPAPFNTPVCGGKEYTDVFKWFKCIRDENPNDNYRKKLIEESGYTLLSGDPTSPDAIMPPFETEFLLTDSWQVWTLIFAFSALTSVSHAAIASFLRPAYESWLTRDTQPLRYLEYSVTASIMMVIVLSLTRVTDIYLLIANALLMCVVNVFGGVIEWITLKVPVDFTPRPSHIRAWAWLVAAVVFTFQFWQLWDIYQVTVEPWLAETNAAAPLMEQLFGFVTVLNIVILACFLTFPVVSIVQFLYYVNARCRSCLQKSSQDDLYFALRFEAAYIFCSLFSKAALVLIVFVSSVQRE
tara:strand:+ start:931 stop:2076 length:1146 start_codon:yes stop_codon:yes gene_type:complete